MKRPSFQFYPADWRKDSALQSCSVAARGLWIEMMCIMHECEPYGYLSINGNAMKAVQLARLVGESEETVKGLLSELEQAGVFSHTETGCIYSRRMVSDEHIRTVRAKGGQAGAEHGYKGAEHGKKGGRPRTDKEGLKTPLATSENPPPSSSSSSSTSVNSLKAPNGALRESARAVRAAPARGTRLSADWVLPEDWGEWAQRECPDWPREHIQRVSAQFRDHWLAKAGAEACKADWYATWRNWVRREPSFGRAASAGGFGTGPPMSRQAALDAENARAKAILFGPQPEVIDV
jgi:hypothetical protein